VPIPAGSGRFVHIYTHQREWLLLALLVRVCFLEEVSVAGVEISPGKSGQFVVKLEYSEAAVAAIKQELLGHGSIETTERYTHVTQRGMERIKSPLDNLEL
jgi:hypothetical protein